MYRMPRPSGGGQDGAKAVTLWSATPRYPSSCRGLAGEVLRGWGLLSTGCALPVAAACCCCCCCGGRSFWLPKLLYTSNKLVHMVVSTKHTARPWRCGRAGERESRRQRLSLHTGNSQLLNDTGHRCRPPPQPPVAPGRGDLVLHTCRGDAPALLRCSQLSSHSGGQVARGDQLEGERARPGHFG